MTCFVIGDELGHGAFGAKGEHQLARLSSWAADDHAKFLAELPALVVERASSNGKVRLLASGDWRHFQVGGRGSCRAEIGARPTRRRGSAPNDSVPVIRSRRFDPSDEETVELERSLELRHSSANLGWRSWRRSDCWVSEQPDGETRPA